jgi:hypothetical protein
MSGSRDARRGLEMMAIPWRGGQSSGGDRPYAMDVTVQQRYGFTVRSKALEAKKARGAGS